MKKLEVALFLVFISVSLSASCGALERVGIIEFDVGTQISLDQAGDAVAEWLARSLSASDSSFSVSPVLQQQDLRKRKLLTSAGGITIAEATKIGRAERLSKVIFGSIRSIEGVIIATACLIDVKKGASIAIGKVESHDLTELRSRIGELSVQLLKKKPATGNTAPVPHIAVDRDPKLRVAAGNALTLFTNEAIALSATDSYDPDGIIVKYSWDLNGDGRADEYRAQLSNVVLTSNNGERTIRLMVLDDFGKPAEQDLTFKILDISYGEFLKRQDSPPVAEASVNRQYSSIKTNILLRGERIILDASASYDPDGSISKYEWDINGDGIADSLARAFSTDRLTQDPGERTISLTVTDDLGKTASTKLDISVSDTTYEEYRIANDIPPVGKFTIHSPATIFGTGPNLEECFREDKVTLDARMSYDPDGRIVEYRWFLNGSSNPVEYGKVVQTRLPSASPGKNTVTLRLKDNLGTESSVTHTLVVSDETSKEHKDRSWKENTVPAIRRVFISAIGLLFIAGLGYLIWYLNP